MIEQATMKRIIPTSRIRLMTGDSLALIVSYIPIHKLLRYTLPKMVKNVKLNRLLLMSQKKHRL